MKHRLPAALLAICLLALAGFSTRTAAHAAPPIPFPKAGGLDGLDSYTLSLRISFKGTLDGQALDTTDLYTRTFSLDPAAQFTTIQTTDDDGKPITLLRGWVGDILYMRAGPDELCAARAVSSADHPIFNPAVLLKPMVQGKETGRETVNGVPVRHYVMDPLQDSSTQIAGEVWIADPGAFVAKYSLSVKGGEGYFGKGKNGAETTTFELQDAGAKKTVAIPAGCPPPLVDLPALPDAANLSRSLSRQSYTTASGIVRTAAFYQEQMKALGWELESGSTPSGSPPAPVGVGAIPNLPQLPQVPGVDLGKFMPPTAPNPAAGASGLQEGWMVFGLAREHRHAYISFRPEGANLRVQVQIVQDR